MFIGRSLFMTTVMTLGVLCAGAPNFLVYNEIEELPCFLFSAYVLISVLLNVAPIFIRSFSRYFSLRALYEQAAHQLISRTFPTVLGHDFDLHVLRDLQNLKGILPTKNMCSCFTCFHTKRRVANDNVSVNYATQQSLAPQLGSQLSVDKVHGRCWCSKVTRVTVFFLLFTVTCMLMSVLVDCADPLCCIGCDFRPMPILSFLVAIMSLVVIYSVFAIRSEFDLYQKNTELLLNASIFFLSFLVAAVLQLSNIYLGSQYRWEILLQMTFVATFTISVPMQVFLFCKKRNESSERDAGAERRKLIFDRLIKTRIGLLHFMKFSINELSIETLLCYLEMSKWKSQFGIMQEDYRFQELKRIYSTFYSFNSRLEVSCSMDRRVYIQEGLRAEGHKCDCLDELMIEMQFLLYDSFKRFQRGELYENYLRSVSNLGG